MKIIDYPQGSQDWIDWRRNKRMASESSVVTGRNPWQKPAQLAKVKRGLSEVRMNPAMARGHKYEPAARAFFESEMGLIGNPVVIEDGDYGASLDWVAHDWSAIAEFKVPSSADTELWVAACGGNIPVYYLDQIAHQMHVSGCSEAYFCVYLPELETGKIIKVPSLQGRMEEIMSAWDAFWAEYMNGEAKEEERNDSEWRDAVDAYKAAKVAADLAAEKVEAAKKVLVDLAHEQSAKGFGLQLIRTAGKETVKYADFVKSLNLEVPDKYKTKGKDSFTVKLDKEQ